MHGYRNHHQPLRSLELYCLLAVTNRELHAFAIQQEVVSLSFLGHVSSRAAIIRVLDRLCSFGELERIQPDGLTLSQSIKFYYRLTPAGRVYLKQEKRALEYAINAISSYEVTGQLD